MESDSKNNEQLLNDENKTELMKKEENENYSEKENED